MRKNETRLPERLKALRGGVSQAKVAVLFGIAQPTYCAWEAGRKEPSLGVVCDIAKHYGVSVDWILGVVDSKQEQVAPERMPSRDAEVARLWALVESQQRTIEFLARGETAAPARVASSAMSSARKEVSA